MVGSITTAELHDRLTADEELQIVDIRTPAQFEGGHIPGAINLPFPQFPHQVDEYEWGETIVCACPKGKSSRQAARMLASFEGVPDDAEILNLEGGYREWDYELEGDAASAPF